LLNAGVALAVGKNEYFKVNDENIKNLCKAVPKVSLGLKNLYLFLRRWICVHRVPVVLKKLRIKIISL
jgi:hypothetical protein